ncbi:hypothetical protein ES703_98269 [subsurface metagenome]
MVDMDKGNMVGTRLTKEEKAKLTEIIKGNGESANKLLGRLVKRYIEDKEKSKVEHPTKHEISAKIVKETKKDSKAVPCPLCEAPLTYHKGVFSDEIRCTNSGCDTRGEQVLSSSMGKPAYLHLLNVRRREFNEIALKKAESEEGDVWDLV